MKKPYERPTATPLDVEECLLLGARYDLMIDGVCFRDVTCEINRRYKTILLQHADGTQLLTSYQTIQVLDIREESRTKKDRVYRDL